MNAILSDTLPLNQIKGVMTQMAHTADVRLASLGKAYVNTMHTTYPDLISLDSQNTLRNLGVQSQALPYTQALPRGWNGNRPTQMTDRNMARAYYQAAGNDKTRAIDLAKTNGWILN